MTWLLNMLALAAMVAGYEVQAHTGNPWVTPILMTAIFIVVLLYTL